MTADAASYIDAFVRRSAALGGAGAVAIDESGLGGVGEWRGDDPIGRLIVTEAADADRLAQCLPQLGVGYASVMSHNAGCVAVMDHAAGWRRNFECAIMGSSDLSSLREPPAPADLVVRQIQRLASDPPGPRLEDAVHANLNFDDEDEEVTEEWLIDFLQSLPRAVLLAASDTDGAIHATSGAFIVGAEALVIFVGTDHAWRGRGIGTWMTAKALTAAQDAGATSAYLDATEAGESIYRRLGFDRLGSVVRYTYAG